MGIDPYINNLLGNNQVLTVIVRLAVALLAGAVVGIERGIRDKAAGMRTHMFVALGSCLIMLVNMALFYMYPDKMDPSRMGAQVVSGIGFLGAGTIMVRGDNQISGLTTAAGLWTTAAIGLAAGSGLYTLALLGIVGIMVITYVFNPIRQRIIEHVNEENYSLIVYSTDGTRALLRLAKELNMQITNLEIDHEAVYHGDQTGNIFTVTIIGNGQVSRQEFIKELRAQPGIKFVNTLPK